MVATRGRGWQLAPSLVAMVEEADRLAPARSRASDGSIGDGAHASRKSDHNPDQGWIDAVDITHDPAGGFDAHAHARNVAARHDPRISYIISNGQIWTAETGEWRPYHGQNPHDHHAHFSVKDGGRWDTSPWFAAVVLFPSPPPPPPASPDPGDDAMYLVRNNIGNDPAFGQVWLMTSNWERVPVEAWAYPHMVDIVRLQGGAKYEVTDPGKWATYMTADPR